MAKDWNCAVCDTVHRYRCPEEVKATNKAKAAKTKPVSLAKK